MFAELKDARLYYEEQGSGEPVFLITGVASNHRFWKSMLPLLEGYRVFTLDNRGVGQTEYSGDFRIEDLADDVIGLMDLLNIPKAHIVGWSMGNLVSQSIAIRYPERVQTLTLVSSYQFRPARSAYFMTLLSKGAADGRCSPDMMSVCFNSFCFPETRFGELESQGIVMPVPKHPEDPMGVYRQVRTMDFFDSRESSKTIRAPTLVVHGGADIMVEPILGRATAAAISGSKYIELPGQGHTFEPSLYIDELRKLLSEHPIS